MESRIFISYRRSDASAWAGRLYDRLVEELPAASVFMDVDTIEPGVDFTQVLSERVGAADIVLAVIGPRWLEASGGDGRRRLDDPGDFVRIEIETSLARGIRVIPVLVDGAAVPRADQLPEAIRGLASRNAIEITHTRFGSDSRALVERLRGLLGPTASGEERGLVRLTHLPSGGKWLHLVLLVLALGLDLGCVLGGIAALAGTTATSSIPTGAGPRPPIPGTVGELGTGSMPSVSEGVLAGAAVALLVLALIGAFSSRGPERARSAILGAAAVPPLFVLGAAGSEVWGSTSGVALTGGLVGCAAGLLLAVIGLRRSRVQTGMQLALRTLAAGAAGIGILGLAATAFVARTPEAASKGVAVGGAIAGATALALLIGRRSRLSLPEAAVWLLCLAGAGLCAALPLLV